ncbi:uncharacterized protein [Onthophagus taurus]|uniref:uncharacterized protein n=1 Tax=Onthophagus taurus TaxID=166361 RepID=UPI0039BDDB99
MTNRPFQSDSTKIYDEFSFQSAPGQFGQNHLMVTYGQQRRTFDTTTTAITGQPFQHLRGNLDSNRQQFNQQVLTPNKQSFPYGVSYTFPNQDQSTSTKFQQLGIDYNGPTQHFMQTNPNQYQVLHQPPQNLYQNQFHSHEFSNPIPPPPMNLTLQQQIALNELQKHALETMLLHETLKRNPFKLRFHFDGQTDTNDLYYKSNQFHPINELNSKESEKQVKNPEALHSETSKRKILKIKSKDNNRDCDKECQNQPEIVSVQVQCDARNPDKCSDACLCEKEAQTERKVCFEKESDERTTKKHIEKRKQSGRSVNDDSDSSSTYDDMSLG